MPLVFATMPHLLQLHFVLFVHLDIAEQRKIISRFSFAKMSAQILPLALSLAVFARTSAFFEW